MTQLKLKFVYWELILTRPSLNQPFSNICNLNNYSKYSLKVEQKIFTQINLKLLRQHMPISETK